MVPWIFPSKGNTWVRTFIGENPSRRSCDRGVFLVCEIRERLYIHFRYYVIGARPKYTAESCGISGSRYFGISANSRRARKSISASVNSAAGRSFLALVSPVNARRAPPGARCGVARTRVGRMWWRGGVGETSLSISDRFASAADHTARQMDTACRQLSDVERGAASRN